MKKTQLLWIMCIMCAFQLSAQKYFTKTGTINFEASVDAFEPVKAQNETVTALLDIGSGELAVLALVKGFRFRNALMEEHFNENYIESDSYPKAVFKGSIKSYTLPTDEKPKEFSIEGELTLHGVSKAITAPLIMTKKGEEFQVETTFSVSPADFNIDIPGVVREKIADKINITAVFTVEKK